MANTLTGLIPTLYDAVDTVSRELVGFIPAVARNAEATQAGKDQVIRVPVTPAVSAADVVAGVTAPDNGDQTIGYVDMTVSKSRYVPIRWNGEEQLGFGRNGQLNIVLRDQFAQAMRTLANEMETDLGALATLASRAYGTAGTTPFASDLSDPANMLKILLDNGAPRGDLQLVLNTTAGAKLRTLAQLTKANEAASDSTLRRGVLLDLHGFMIRESAGVASHTKGTGSGATTNTAGYAIGATTITLASAGTGTILAGDVITFAGDTNKYVVKTGDSDVSNGGTIVLQEPGLRQAIPASATAITIGNAYTGNLAFDRNALQLLARVPAMPIGGDMADDVTIVVDPVSGIPFQVAVYRQYRQVKFEIGAAWGVQLVAPRHSGILLG
jgi:hypothetical protein